MQCAIHLFILLLLYSTFVDESCKRVQIVDAKKNAKKRVAEKLLAIEKGILLKALAAVRELINELPNSAISPCVGPYLPILK